MMSLSSSVNQKMLNKNYPADYVNHYPILGLFKQELIFIGQLQYNFPFLPPNKRIKKADRQKSPRPKSFRS